VPTAARRRGLIVRRGSGGASCSLPSRARHGAPLDRRHIRPRRAGAGRHLARRLHGPRGARHAVFHTFRACVRRPAPGVSLITSHRVALKRKPAPRHRRGFRPISGSRHRRLERVRLGARAADRSAGCGCQAHRALPGDRVNPNRERDANPIAELKAAFGHATGRACRGDEAAPSPSAMPSSCCRSSAHADAVFRPGSSSMAPHIGCTRLVPLRGAADVVQAKECARRIPGAQSEGKVPVLRSTAGADRGGGNPVYLARRHPGRLLPADDGGQASDPHG